MASQILTPVRRAARRSLERLGYQVSRVDETHPIPRDCDDQTRAIIEAVRPYTLTPPERIMALCDAVRYIEREAIPGAIVECGVWRGGSMMAAASALLALGTQDRDLYLYDTFTEFPKPDERDRHVLSDNTPEEMHEYINSQELFAHLPIDRVRELVVGTGYPAERIHMIQGLVEDTIPDQAPPVIALCRLDTDWYRSTLHELKHLYSRISPRGVLIVDDYGEFEGARDAVDEFLERLDARPLMHRVDFSCRVLVA